MNSQHTLPELQNLQNQKLESRSKQQLNCDVSLTSSMLPSNPSQPSYQANKILKVKNMIGARRNQMPEKQQSENFIGSNAVRQHRERDGKMKREENSTLYNIGGQEYTDTRRSGENQLSSGRMERHLRLGDSPDHDQVPYPNTS